MRAMVTGVAGFIGSSLAERLLREGNEVVGVDCMLDYYPRPIKEANLGHLREYDRFEFHETSLLDLDWPSALDGAQAVFHQAAQAGVRSSWGRDFEIYTQNNILATQKLLEACKGRDLRVVAASSSSVYGDTKKLPMDETDRPQPVSPYGVSKLAAEQLCVLYARNFGIHTVSLRYFTVYGPRQRPDMAFHICIRRMMDDAPFRLFGSGEQTRDFTYIDDIVESNLLAAAHGRSGAVYNIGGGSRISLNAVIAILEEILGRPAQVERVERALGDVADTYARADRARDDLGFVPQSNLRDGLAAEYEWIQSNLPALTGSV